MKSAAKALAPTDYRDLLAATVDKHIGDATHEPGVCAAVLHDGEVVACDCRGLTRLPHGDAITAQTAFRLASVSKQFTAMAVLVLRARGALRLDDPVRAHLDELPPWADPITLRHLLTHTSGVLPYEQRVPDDSPRQVSDADVLALLAAETRTAFNPGEKFYYSNTGYALLACVVERAAGVAYPAFLHEALFRPLGMTHTLARVDGGPAVANRAYGHVRRDDAWVEADQGPTTAVLGDGGIYCPLVDYARWDAALGDGAPGTTVGGVDMLPPGAVAESFTPAHDNAGTPLPYGLGWRLEQTADGQPVVYHTGNTTGFNICVRRLPSAGLTVLAFANRSGTHTHKITRDVLARLSNSEA